MFNFLGSIKPTALPPGQLSYHPDLPHVEPITDCHEYMRQQPDSNIEHFFVALEFERKTCLCMIGQLESDLKDKLKIISKMKVGMGIIERIANEPKPYKIFARPSDYILVEDELEPIIKVMVKWDQSQPKACTLPESKELHRRQLSIAYEKMLQLEYDLSLLRYQMQVIVFNKRTLHYWKRRQEKLSTEKGAELEESRAVVQHCPNLPYQLQNYTSGEENLNETEYLKLNYLNAADNDDRLRQYESELYKELNELRQQRAELPTQQSKMDHLNMVEMAKRNRVHMLAMLHSVRFGIAQRLDNEANQ